MSHDGHAQAVVDAVLAYDRRLPVLGLPGSAWLRLAADAGLTTVGEAFADRGYTAEATLVPRSQPGALVTEVDEVAARVTRLATEGVIEAVDGSEVTVDARSICVHGDSPGAVAVAIAVRDALRAAGVAITPFVS